MSISSIIQQMLHYIIPATILVCIAVAFALVGYFFVYKKLFKGNKTINKSKVIMSVFIIIYLLVVFGLTCMNRSPGMDRGANLKLFSSYVDAWNTFTVRAWQFIIFNIVMFIPLGILLPLFSRIFTKVRWILLATVLTTLFVEMFQLLMKMGMFELDDLFHNTLGGMIGYCLFMYVYRVTKRFKKSDKNENIHVKSASAVKFLVLPAIVIAIFSGIFIKYYLQEFGNMPLNQVSGADISKYTIELSTEISNKESVAPVYKYVHSSDKEFAISQAKKVMNDLNMPDFIGYDIMGEEIFFQFDNSSLCSFWWDISNGSWSYNKHEDDTDSKTVIKTDDEKYKIAVDFAKSHNIRLDDAKLDPTDSDNIIFEIDPDIHNKTEMTSGKILFSISDDGTISRIRHDVYKNNFVRNVKIISTQSAYQKVLKGNFYDWSDIPGGKIQIKDIKISYLYDTKGFYQPVYEFDGILNGKKWRTCIVAMK